MDASEPETDAVVERAPQGFVESVLANCRPQPAIPAVFIMLVSVLVPALLQQEPIPDDSWIPLLVAIGSVVSCALAVAAGFCSLVPQAVWIAMAWWCLQQPLFASGYNTPLLILGMVIAGGAFCLQLWRIRTGKFVPTIREYPEENDIQA